MTVLALALAALLAPGTAESTGPAPVRGDDETIARLEEAVASAPDDPELYAKLATELVRSERWEEASAVAARAAERGPELAWKVGIRVFDALHSVGRFGEAYALLGRIRNDRGSATRRLAWRTLDVSSRTSYRQAAKTLAEYLLTGPDDDEAEIVYNAVLDRWFGGQPSGLPRPEKREEDSGLPTPDVILPILRKKVEPYFPKSGRSDRSGGEVVLMVVVRTDGSIGRTMIISSTHADYSVSALDAVKRWKYEPATQNGRPVAIYYTIRMDYRR